MSECNERCNGQQKYTDGVFWYCACRARIMNIIVGAGIKHKDTFYAEREQAES